MDRWNICRAITFQWLRVVDKKYSPSPCRHSIAILSICSMWKNGRFYPHSFNADRHIFFVALLSADCCPVVLTNDIVFVIRICVSFDILWNVVKPRIVIYIGQSWAIHSFSLFLFLSQCWCSLHIRMRLQMVCNRVISPLNTHTLTLLVNIYPKINMKKCAHRKSYPRFISGSNGNKRGFIRFYFNRHYQLLPFSNAKY